MVEREISGEILGNRLKTPFGLAVDQAGRTVVSDVGNNRLLRFTPELTPEIEKGGYGREPGLFDKPTFLTLDNGLNLFVSDERNRRVVRLNSQLSYVDEIAFRDEDDLTKFGVSSGVAVTGYGEVWIADREKNQIAVFDNVGHFDRFVGDFGYSGGQLHAPEKIVPDRQGGFIVCDAGNKRLAIYDGYGNFASEVRSAAFGYPVAVAGSHEFLWVVDAGVDKVFYCDRGGKILFEAGPALVGTSAVLTAPSDIEILRDGRLLICDSGNDRVLVCRVGYDDR